MNILIDMNLSPLWCEALESHGHICKHWFHVGDPRDTDETILQWASQNEYIVLTHDLDFGAILSFSLSRAPSVILLRTQDVMPSNLSSSLVKIIHQYENELQRGALIILDEMKLRVRILPLDRT